MVTTLVVAMPPEPLATFLADGGYLPRGVPLIKRILALPGQFGVPKRAAHQRRWNRDGRGTRA